MSQVAFYGLAVNRVALIALVLALVLTGCGERKAEVSKPTKFVHGRVSFDYPGNWEVTTDEVVDDFHVFMLETPGEAFVYLTAFEVEEGEASLRDEAKEFSKELELDVALVKSGESTMADEEARNGFERIRERMTFSVLGEKIVQERLHAGKTIAGLRVYLVVHAVGEDFAKVEPGFDLILDTFEVLPAEPATE